MTIFALRKKDGAYYPMVLIDESQEVFCDDACGGYETRPDVIEEVKKYYEEDAACVSQRTLYDTSLRRSE